MTSRIMKKSVHIYIKKENYVYHFTCFSSKLVTFFNEEMNMDIVQQLRRIFLFYQKMYYIILYSSIFDTYATMSSIENNIDIKFI